MKFLSILVLMFFSTLATSAVAPNLNQSETTKTKRQEQQQIEALNDEKTESKIKEDTIKECDDLLIGIKGINKQFSPYSNNPMIRKELERKVDNIKNIIDLLPKENKKETCINMQIQIDSLLPGMMELDKTAKGEH